MELLIIRTDDGNSYQGKNGCYQNVELPAIAVGGIDFINAVDYTGCSVILYSGTYEIIKNFGNIFNLDLKSRPDSNDEHFIKVSQAMTSVNINFK